MAFFKFRKGAEASAAAAANPQESIETMRRRAKHRLLGATVLVLAAVIGFPILFETQPRPVAIDIPIDIPDKNKVKPLQMPSAAPAKPAAAASAAGLVEAAPKASTLSAASALAKAATPQAAAPVAKGSVVPAAASVGGKEEIVPDKPVVKAEPKLAATTEPKATEPSKPPSDGKEAVAGEARFIVQVGAFAEADRVRDVRQKLERAGLKTYAQVIETKDGKRTRVRVGPFASRVQAEQAVEKIKAIDLPAAILSL